MNHFFRFSIYVSAGSFLFFVGSVSAEAQTLRQLSPEQTRPAVVSVWDADFTGRDRFPAFDASNPYGGHIASYDIDQDGKPELVIGAGEGAKPIVKVFSLTGELEAEFLAYEETFLGGVRVAAGDIQGDGIPEIVTSPGAGRDPMVRVFQKDGSYEEPNGFHAYQPEFRGGVHLAVGDLNGDGKDEIVTTPGPGGGPHVRLFNGAFKSLGDLFAFDAGMREGITPAIVRTENGAELAIGIESWERPAIRRYALQGGILHLTKEFLAFDESWKHGVTIEAVDINGDGVDEIAAHGNGGSVPELRILSQNGDILGKYMIHDPTYRGGLSVTQVPGMKKIASISRTPLVVASTEHEKEIHVNLTRQRLYAFEHGRLANTFLISSGTYRYPTPVIETTVQQKIPSKTYRWSYGANHPDNYEIHGVKWNLRILGPYYIHGAYWHNNFGNRMSHGCVNVHNSNAEWIYNWADVGTPVKTYYGS